jgi:DNA ligase-associated metallophosphoesterase
MIFFAGQEIELRCAGTLFWPSMRMLVVSDLHLEKGSSFLRRGFFLPPHDTHDTLVKLAGEIEAVKPERLILLGDSFHDEKGFHRLGKEDEALFLSLVRSQETIWITGNHDGSFVPKGIESRDEVAFAEIAFRHEAKDVPGFEISGHYHPGAQFHYKGSRIASRCFAVSERRIIMPAFGSYTGNLDAFDPVLRPFLGEDFTVYMCLKERVCGFPAAVLQK